MNAEIARPVRKSALAWRSGMAGFLLVAAARCWAWFGDHQPVVPISAMLVAGLFLLGVGIAVRLHSSENGTHSPLKRLVLGLLLTVVQVGLAALFTWILVAACLAMDPFAPGPLPFGYPPPIHVGVALILWVLTVPLCVFGARAAWNALQHREESSSLDAAGLLLVAFVAVHLAAGTPPADAESLRFFLGVMTLCVAATVPLALVSSGVRRLVVSALITLHFLAIATATLAVAPSPWVMQQIWTRLARPYLEFMYLNNAYHFYSPDPGPASFMWFRVYYDTGEKDPTSEKDENGNPIVFPKLDAVWVKIPDLDEAGNHRYRVALEYQRYLSVTENITPSEQTQTLYFRGADGKATPLDFFYSRIVNSPDAGAYKQEIIGKPKPRFILEVPFHPYMSNEQQYIRPTAASKRLIASYVKHAARRPHPTRPDWPVHCVRAYRVTHFIPTWQMFSAGQDPQDAELYRAFYVGFFDSNGELVDPDEPLLYWLLPAIRQQSARPESPVRDYARLHAGDPKWIFLPTSKKWVEEKELNP